MTVCPACYDGAHKECEGQGCYCDCQLEDMILAEERSVIDHEAEYGIVTDEEGGE